MRKNQFLQFLAWACLFTVTALLTIVSATPNAQASVPQLINYQGRLTDTGGDPVANGSYSVIFTIYDAASGGTSKWAETQTVTTTNGLFAVLLGSVNPIIDTVFNAPARFLGIKVGADPEINPRTMLVTVPWAFRVNTVDGAAGGTVSGDIEITGKATIGPGHANSGNNAFVAGANNTASGNYSVVAGGGGASQADSNSASGVYSAIGGGTQNTASGWAASVGGGYSNEASDNFSTVGGGQSNTASNNYSTVGGGYLNTASGIWSTVGGGNRNDASGTYATVGGGQNDTASGYQSVVAGGSGNVATDTGAVVGGGIYNNALGVYSVVAGGGGWNEFDGNSAKGYWSVVGGGKENRADSTYTVVCGGHNNAAEGIASTIGGGKDNVAKSLYAVIGGGGFNENWEEGAVIGGGTSNKVYQGASHATIAGGQGCWVEVDASWGTIGGGALNRSSGSWATVGGGKVNEAGGQASTIPGGFWCAATGDYSFASGRRSKATHQGAFVWADATDADFASSAVDQFNIRASGGTRIYSNAALSSGVTLAAGASSWSAVCDSSLKRNIREVDCQEVLERVAELPVSQWSYESQDASIEHIGPMAQDFYRLFGLGEDDKHINTLDPDGVALAAIKGLHRENQQLKQRLSEMEERLSKLESR